jgi:penicillin amidase
VARRRRASRGFASSLWQAAKILLILVILVASGIGFACWLTLPSTRTTLHIPGLSAPVAVTLDEYGVPRIKAGSELDAAVALGYLHARDRMFQMELMRRAASGRLSELAGARALPLDRMARTLGEMQHAERAYKDLPDEARTLLMAYSAGVNAWITQRGRFAALEFLALGPPVPWRPVDCLLWSETVSLWLSGNYRTELARLSLAGKVPPDKIFQLWPQQPDTPAPDSASLLTRQGFNGALDRLPHFPSPFTLPGEASNAWAVDSRHSATGAPLLAGDPHLRLQYPALWYLARIDTPNNTLVGATAPGVPFLVIGRNAHIAWSFTNTGIDTQDVFVETPLPGGMYATPDGPKPFETRQEIIHVRGGADDILTVRSTRHGPVISDLLGPKGGPVLAVEMAQNELDSGAPGLLALDRATSVAEAGRAAALLLAPMQNLTVADHGGIALFTTGKVPIRRGGDGSVPAQGAEGKNDWVGYAGGDSLPHFVAPTSGVLENANERTAPADFPVFLGKDWPDDFRALRIHEWLDTKPTLSEDDFQAMQADDVSVFAARMLPFLRALPRQPGMVGRAQTLLDQWDGAMDADKPQPLIFNALMQRFVADTLAASHIPQSDSGPWPGFAAWLLTAQGGATWCDGDCRPALGRALSEAVRGLAAAFGEDPAAWRWGKVHLAQFVHPLLGEIPLIGSLASRQISVPGDDTTLFRGASGALGDFSSVHGAAYRGVYDLASLDRSRFVVTPGQSGNILSAHAWDLLGAWAAGTTIAIGPLPHSVSATVNLLP